MHGVGDGSKSKQDDQSNTVNAKDKKEVKRAAQPAPSTKNAVMYGAKAVSMSCPAAEKTSQYTSSLLHYWGAGLLTLSIVDDSVLVLIQMLGSAKPFSDLVIINLALWNFNIQSKQFAKIQYPAQPLIQVWLDPR